MCSSASFSLVRPVSKGCVHPGNVVSRHGLEKPTDQVLYAEHRLADRLAVMGGTRVAF